MGINLTVVVLMWYKFYHQHFFLIRSYIVWSFELFKRKFCCRGADNSAVTLGVAGTLRESVYANFLKYFS